MELIEYYRIIRRRLWMPLALAALAFFAVSLLFVFGPKHWRSEGQMLAQPGAALRVQWSGSGVEVIEEAEIWGTLQQFVESRALAQQAAASAGLIQAGGDTSKLQALAFERSKRGNMFMLRGNAPSPELSSRYVDAAMDKLPEMWNQTRLERARAMAADMRRQLEEQTPGREALQAQIAQAEAGSPPGKPTDLLAWTQTQISENQGALSAAYVDINVARDRLNGLSDMARRERGVPLEQRTWVEGGLVTTPVATLEARLADLEAQRARMLQTRTEQHPEVQGLSQDIRSVNMQVEAERARTRRSQDRVSPGLQQQIVMARMELSAAQRRVQALQGRDTELRNRIPSLQDRTRRYLELQERLKPVEDQRAALMANLKTLDSEARRLRESADLTVVDQAAVVSTNRTLTRYLSLAVAGLAAGFIIGVLLVFMLHYLDVGSQPKATTATPA